MKGLLFLIVLILTIVAFSFFNSKQVAQRDLPGTSAVVLQDVTLLKTYCYACHNPASKSHDQIIAPPMAAVKSRYQMQFRSKEEFISKMSEFVREPSKEKAIMFGAVQKFSIMPKSITDEKIINQIVTYILENKLEEPVWFQDEYKRNGKGNVK